ncbi:hypothetical protein BT96DRAFT_989351 [Gymnopus androsaceus JB14]|uniref:Uncharacterized protein n=1 Tax=Gymnopus androsaceus JB14 TaxID=1447944 RepID=A0A6A4HYQ2_9AGAR|nr:hypothetical protein BT96DRAFT_989351 [Gymnopus androsaceus JB14]
MSSFSEWTIRNSTSGNNSSTTSASEQRYYERLLGSNELGFYWDSVYRGTADTLQHAVVKETTDSDSSHTNIQSEANVRAAWVALKTQYPLLGARIEERRTSRSSSPNTLTSAPLAKTDGTEDSSVETKKDEEVYFIVDSARLYTSEPPHAHPREVTFFSCASEEEVLELEEGIINGFGWREVWTWAKAKDAYDHDYEDASSRILSNALPACILFIRRTDCASTFHVMINLAHLITDGVGNSTLLSGFLDLLSRGSMTLNVGAPTDPERKSNFEALEKRLRISVASEALCPDEKPGYPRARRRWHRVLGKVLSALRNAKKTGGHTLPRLLHTSTSLTPAKSSNISYVFTPAQTIRILRGCKDLGITFGNAHPVLGQIAATRVLLRRRLRTLARRKKQLDDANSTLSKEEDIDDDEWTYRRRQPMLTAGPANLRPYLDREWYAAGGAENVSLSITFFFFTLPFMPLGESGLLADGDGSSVSLAATSHQSGSDKTVDTNMDVVLPPFEKMLSRKRFLLRCNLIRTQASELFRHPRFLDVGLGRMPERIEWSRAGALAWRDVGGKRSPTGSPIPAQEQSQIVGGAVSTHGGSSFGNSDRLVPPYYPRASTSSSGSKCTSSTPSSHPPTLHLIRSTTRLRCRPAELYLGAATARGQLRLNVFWDENVYKKQVVEEWLDEVRRAAEWFLGTSTDTEVDVTASGGGVTPPVVVMAKM